jgi:hypothetical protein
VGKSTLFVVYLPKKDFILCPVSTGFAPTMFYTLNAEGGSPSGGWRGRSFGRMASGTVHIFIPTKPALLPDLALTTWAPFFMKNERAAKCSHVILSEAKDLLRWAVFFQKQEILRLAPQNDSGLVHYATRS